MTNGALKMALDKEIEAAVIAYYPGQTVHEAQRKFVYSRMGAALIAAKKVCASEPCAEIEAATIERCALAVREACCMCNEGVADVIDGAPVECEYCGRPMAAIRVLTSTEQVRASEPDAEYDRLRRLDIITLGQEVGRLRAALTAIRDTPRSNHASSRAGALRGIAANALIVVD